MIAALPMYFAPRPALDAFWSALAAHLSDALHQHGAGAQWLETLPTALHWPDDYHAHWLREDLLLSQTCGYPLTTRLRGQVQLVGCFAYRAPQASGVWCRSVLICRADDARQQLNDFDGATLVCNGTDSQSGYNALRALVAGSGLLAPRFGECHTSGSHVQSLDAVRDGSADLASIDCVTFALWQDAQPEHARQIRVLACTDAYPGLPLITSRHAPAPVLAALRQALQAVTRDESLTTVRAALRICGFEATPLWRYERCVDMERSAAARGVTML